MSFVLSPDWFRYMFGCGSITVCCLELSIYCVLLSKQITELVCIDQPRAELVKC
uniref:Bm14810 n=1 Tax=Brugia malayi TaxID=6279 RepID=A0A0J9XX70_BRUMA|nr:Bm14810 [Brugia malayi]